jgi:DNA polymerase-3 subunit beta
VTVNRGSLISSLRRVSILADSLTHQVRLSVSKDKIDLKVQTNDVGEASESLAGEYTGEDLDVGFNASYLSEALRNMEGESVVLALDKPTTAAVLTPAVEGPEESLALVMPLRLSD